MCTATRTTVPAWPASERRVGFTCICCEEYQEVLVEGCEPGAVVDIGCGNKKCASVNRVQIRRAMFS